jgi:hypothetical protein
VLIFCYGILNEFNRWCADGTFKVAPDFALQIYTIHAFIGNKAIPTLYTILGDKRKETYVRLFQKIKELQPALEPESVMFDFETGALNAFKETFSKSDLAGCSFHLSQNLWWQIQKIPGLHSSFIRKQSTR